MVLINEVLILSLSLSFSLQRSRMTEAINKSLPETPFQKTKVVSQQISLLRRAEPDNGSWTPPSL
jgi:hypothetical protein